MTPALLTVNEVAERLRIGVSTVTLMCRQGKLPAVKVGKQWRINAEKLAQLIKC